MNLERMVSRKASIGGLWPASGSRANVSLNAAYVHGTSGPAVAIRYVSQGTGTIDELYLFMDAHGGTLGNITMEAQVYNENATFVARPGSTSRDTSTATAMPAADDKWIKFTFGTPYTPTAGEILWLVAYTTNGVPATDFPQIMNTTTTVFGSPTAFSLFVAYTTTNGFSSNGSIAAELPCVVKQGSTYSGQPFTQRNGTYYTNNTLERGIQITPTEDVRVVGAEFSATASFADLRILADATAPGGGAIATFDLDSDANETTADIVGAKWFDTPVTLSGGVTYKCTVTVSANNQTPIVAEIEDYASYSSVFDALRGYDLLFTPWGAVDNGAGGWTIDKAICPEITLVIGDFPAVDTPSVGNVTEDDTVRGATGTYHEATAAEVQSGVQFGAGGTEFTGTLAAGGGLLRHPGMSGGCNG